MVGYGCSVVVCNGEGCLLVDQFADERGVKYETLWTDFVTSHPLGEGGDFGGGEGCVPYAYFGN